jgi:hypothetical protein
MYLSLKIPSAKTIGTLKEAIKGKKQHAFQDVNPDNIVLWKVSIPSDGNLNKNVNLELDEGSLSGLEELSELFLGEAAKKCIHIVVKSPAGDCALLSV